MMHPLSKRLLSLSDDIFHHGSPRPPEELEQLERVVGERFPDDYRAVLLEVGPFQVRGPKIWIILDLVEDVLLSLDDDFLSGRMPGIVMIGNDNGDYGYYYDPKGRLGRGAFALYCVDRGTLTFEKSRFVAPTLTEAIDQALAGEDFRERPTLGN
jgi:hypothetical protein